MVEDLVIKQIPKKWKNIKQGGEAFIYDMGGGKVAKVFMNRHAHIFEGNREQEEAAARKLKEIQTKLPEMLSLELPEEVVKPKCLIRTQKGNVCGYVMDFIPNAVSLEFVWNTTGMKEKMAILRRLIDATKKLHSVRFLLGDYVPRDVLWNKSLKRIYFLDADSLDFGEYRCRTFSLGYVHPDYVGFKKNKKTGVKESYLKKLYTKEADWFSFFAIALKVLVGVDPFEGVHNLCSKELRVEKQISIFDENVKYPESAISIEVIPCDILDQIRSSLLLARNIIPDSNKFVVR